MRPAAPNFLAECLQPNTTCRRLRTSEFMLLLLHKHEAVAPEALQSGHRWVGLSQATTRHANLVSRGEIPLRSASSVHQWNMLPSGAIGITPVRKLESRCRPRRPEMFDHCAGKLPMHMGHSSQLLAGATKHLAASTPSPEQQNAAEREGCIGASERRE